MKKIEVVFDYFEQTNTIWIDVPDSSGKSTIIQCARIQIPDQLKTELPTAFNPNARIKNVIFKDGTKVIYKMEDLMEQIPDHLARITPSLYGQTD